MIIAQVRSDDIDEAVEATRPFFPDFSASRSDRPVMFALTAYRSSGLSFSDFSMAGLSARTAAESEAFGACVVDLEGVMTAGRDTVDPAEPFALPPALGADIIRLRSQVLHIDEDVLTRFVDYDLGRRHFDLRMRGYEPISSQAATQWRSTNDFVRERMADGSADSPLIAASLQQLVLTAYLHVFPTTWSDARAPQDGGGAVPAALHRAKTYIEEHAHEAVTVLDVAQAARMSTRGLQEAFRREFATTPMAYLHTVRLAGARGDLITANPPEGATVADIARRWGFTHLGRFSARYRDAYGESPSSTLRR